jgi:glycosyltransferase involved in cell wall biosynthesis
MSVEKIVRETSLKFNSSTIRLKANTNVILLGPSLSQNGGMATVQRLILKHISTSFLKIQHICTHDEGSYLHRWSVFNKALLTLLHRLAFQDIDLVHINLSERGSVLRAAVLISIVRLFRKAIIVHAHGAEFESFFLHLPGYLKTAIAYVFNHCQGFIVLSQSCKQFYVPQLSLNPDRVFILPNAVELPEKIPSRNQFEVTKIVFCGRVGERKGSYDLIRAYASLPSHMRICTQLLFAGDGEIDNAKQLVNNLGLDTEVVFLDWINPTQRDLLLKSADIFVLPSRNEGLPMSILEAMAWGLPIITTPVGGIAEFVSSNKNGLLVEPGNIDQLAQAIQFLLEDREYRLKLGNAARQTVESMGIERYCRELANIYSVVVKVRE